MSQFYRSDAHTDWAGPRGAPPRLSAAAGVLRARAAIELTPRLVALALAVVAEILLLLVALVPQSIWAAHGFPDGPIPRSFSPVIAGLFYVLPAVTGMLSRRWQVAIVLATLPAWLDLGAFAVAAASRIGPFYLATDPHSASTVGTLELFAALGALGWLARTAALMVLGRGGAHAR
ncbi:MAG TPA: hypothetical protein VGS80_14555 [Ktedonobacterales bacterium]|nr:hypothetical protein [Ktedonobacterales bacterium]